MSILIITHNDYNSKSWSHLGVSVFFWILVLYSCCSSFNLTYLSRVTFHAFNHNLRITLSIQIHCHESSCFFHCYIQFSNEFLRIKSVTKNDHNTLTFLVDMRSCCNLSFSLLSRSSSSWSLLLSSSISWFCCLTISNFVSTDDNQKSQKWFHSKHSFIN